MKGSGRLGEREVCLLPLVMLGVVERKKKGVGKWRRRDVMTGKGLGR